MRTRRSWLQRLTSYFVMEHVWPDGTRVVTALDPAGHLQPGPWFVVNIYEPPADLASRVGPEVSADRATTDPDVGIDDLVA